MDIRNYKVYRRFLCIFKLQENVVVFISGILVSASINIFTSVIPSQDDVLPLNVVVSAILMLISSFFMMIWAMVAKQHQDNYYIEAKNVRNWFEEIKKDNGDIKLSILFFLSLASAIDSIVLLYV